MEQIALFISKHPTFFTLYGNWILIPLVILLSIAQWKLSKHKTHRIFIKWLFLLPLLSINFILATMLVMINFPLKSMLTSLTKVEQGIGQSAPALQYINLRNQQEESISGFKGKVVMINFWGTFCAPCIEEFADLIKMEKAYPDHLVIVALTDEEPEKVVKFMQKYACPDKVGITLQHDWINLETFRPVTIILDQQGRIQQYVFGKKDYAYFKASVEQYL